MLATVPLFTRLLEDLKRLIKVLLRLNVVTTLAIQSEITENDYDWVNSFMCPIASTDWKDRRKML
jgi:hypothetical protein